jgi:hypothetical protein
MHHLQIYRTIHNNLAPISFQKVSLADQFDNQLKAEECDTWKELCLHWKENFFFTTEIQNTLATMIAVVLSTTTEGGQLGLRVIGPPGSAKSTLAECLSEAMELVYSVSKFTGIVSGFGSVSDDQQTAKKIDGKCLLVKDADPMMQMTNLAQIESELRDGLGDGVIRATYKTGRELEIRTLFTSILCGTKSLRGMDNALLGARYIDIVIHNKDTPTRDIVRTAIKSQGRGIIDKLTRNLDNGTSSKDDGEDNNNIDSTIRNGSDTTPEPNKRKPIINKLAPKTIGFLRKKKEYIDSGRVNIKYPNSIQEERIYAAGELIAFLRAKPDTTKGGELKYRVEKELSTRLGELLIRLYLFLQIVINDEE